MSKDYDSEEDVGFHFDPTNQEIIDYLIRKDRGEPCEDFIVEKDVYAKEPWLLDHTNDPFFKEDEWYYFGRRTQISGKKISCGKNVKRKIIGDNKDGIDRGYWRVNGNKNIIDEKTGKIIGVKQSLTFKMRNNDNNTKKQKRGVGVSANVPGSESSWNMNEFVLPEKANTFQTLVLCKIKKKKNSKKMDDHHHEASTSTCHHHRESIYSEQQPINEAHRHGSEIPRVGSMSLTSFVSETEINREQSLEGSMIHQVDAFSLKKKNEKVEAMEGQKDVMENFPTKGLLESFLINTKDQQPSLLVPARMYDPPVRLGDKSLPIELDNDFNLKKMKSGRKAILINLAE